MLRSRSLRVSDRARIAVRNRQLQIDEGADAMEPADIALRLERWLAGRYDGLIFETEAEPIGYALFCPTDPDLKGADGIYLRQFFIAPEYRRAGNGGAAFRLFLEAVVRGRRVVLEALESNPGGQAFWRSVGLRPYSRAFELLPDAEPTRDSA